MLLVIVCTIASFHLLHAPRNIGRVSVHHIAPQRAASNETGKCTMKIIFVSQKQGHVAPILTSIDALANEFFRPCVVIGGKTLQDVEFIEQAALDNAPRTRVTVKHIGGSNLHSILQEASCKQARERIVLLEDDFVFCDHALLHLMHILTQVKFEQHAGVRFSNGVNGVMFYCRDLMTIADLMLNEQGTLQAEHVNRLGKPFLTYRYQLLRNIAHVYTSAEYPHPQCLETLFDAGFDLKRCSHRLFSPCGSIHVTGNQDMPPDNTFVPAYHPMHKHPLAALQQLMPVKCAAGMSCNDCCAAKQRQCKQDLFMYINDCSIIQEHFACPGNACSMDNGIAHSAATLPRFNSQFGCAVASNPSRMRCDTARPTDERLCPC